MIAAAEKGEARHVPLGSSGATVRRFSVEWKCNVGLWHKADMPVVSLDVRFFGGKPEKHTLVLSLTASEPEADSNQHPVLLEREDCKLVAWYRSFYAPRTGGAYDSHHRTAGIAGRTWRRGGGVAARGACAADDHASGRVSQQRNA
jgi:hypothetical protein